MRGDSQPLLGGRLPNLPDDYHARVVRVMRGLLLIAIGIGAVERNVDILVNATGGLAVTFVPAVLERKATVSMDAGLSVWLTAAVFLHVVGAVGIPGVPGNFYSEIWWWDHLTHVASASLVAGIGYTVLRGIDEHSNAVTLPRRLTIVFTALFVLAFGVYWEIFEFAVGQVRIGGESALTQYGVEDTLKDLAFDTVGGIVVGVLGQIYLIGSETGLA